MADLTVIILTKNEALHIARAIASVRDIATRVLVVDSGSSDETVPLAMAAGATVLHHHWTTHAAQFNWALDHIKGRGDWVLRLDADEVATPELCRAISDGLPDVSGIHVIRQIKFLGQMVRFGGVGRLWTLRLFRNGSGRCEDRFMDEHIVVDGATASLKAGIIDDNRKPLDWWVTKHNDYASREVVDVLNSRYRLGLSQTGPDQSGLKRWIKQNFYQRLPTGMRAGAYFFYRYILRFGLLDGRKARVFHVLQGFWYRYLVDQKLAEVERFMAETGGDPVTAIHRILNISLSTEERIAA